MRRAVQMVFQDPFASLNPRMRVGEIIEEGMISLGVETRAQARQHKVVELLERVGLSATMRTSPMSPVARPCVPPHSSIE